MHAAPLPLTRNLVLIGGGHTHALVLRMWGMDPLPGVAVTLIAPAAAATYTGMLPGHIAGHYARQELAYDLAALARFAGARWIRGAATGIDRTLRRIAVPGRPDVAYDVASVNIGITTDLPRLPGYADHGLPAKPMGDYATRWDAFLHEVATGRAAPQVAVIGGGVAGVELAMATAHRLRAQQAHAPRVTLIERRTQVLGDVGAAARRALLRHLAGWDVQVITGVAVARLEATGVVLDDGRVVPADFIISATGARPHGWFAATGLGLTDGFLAVGPTLATSDPAIFAVGDCAHMQASPRPKAGVFAVRQAPVLAANLRAVLSGGRLRAYRPQRGYLKLVSTGDRQAVADRFGLHLSGGWVWRQKDRIDRRFMARLADLPPMTAAPLPAAVALGVRDVAAVPLCGGCGAKVGRAGVMAGLAMLPPPTRADMLTGPGDDAAVLRVGGVLQVITTDHLRAFGRDPFAMARVAAVHALGDIWAMGAAPQAALAQIVLPRMSEPLQHEMLREIMAAAAAVFAAAGAPIVGGHTSTGDELTIGFTVTGLPAGSPVGKGGARSGDALVLTKPIGTGVILAAEMAGAAMGAAGAAAVAAAWDSMAQGSGPAAAALARHATAMTDVTGFGLAGHLAELLAASGTAARLDWGQVPVLPGAAALAAAGWRSSLYHANRSAVAELIDAAAPDLMFDPQTAGGLLAAVPQASLDAVLAALATTATPGSVIGLIVPGAARITLD